jgi:hypothetical protein
VRTAAEPLLVNDDGHAEILDGVDLRLRVAREEVAHEGAEGLVELAPRFRRHSVKHDGGFPRAGHAGEDGDLPFGNPQRHVLKVVLPGAPDLDVFLRHGYSSTVALNRRRVAAHHALPPNLRANRSPCG